MDLLNVKIAYMNDEEYESLLNMLIASGVDVPDVKNDLAFAIEADYPMIVFRDIIKTLTKDEQRAITAHEVAHLVGIKDEEEADRWAISALTTEKEKDIIISQWEYRHGHEYEEVKEDEKDKTV